MEKNANTSPSQQPLRTQESIQYFVVTKGQPRVPANIKVFTGRISIGCIIVKEFFLSVSCE